MLYYLDGEDFGTSTIMSINDIQKQIDKFFINPIFDDNGIYDFIDISKGLKNIEKIFISKNDISNGSFIIQVVIAKKAIGRRINKQYEIGVILDFLNNIKNNNDNYILQEVKKISGKEHFLFYFINYNGVGKVLFELNTIYG